MDLWMLPSVKLLAKTERYSDCIVVVDDDLGKKTYRCHKLILSCASEIFERMLYIGQEEESRTVELTLNDVERDVFEKFRSYIYGFQKKELGDYSNETLVKLIYFGKIYLINSITTDCIQTLTHRASSCMDISELLQLFQCAHAIGNNTFISIVSSNIKRSKTLVHSSIYELSPSVYHHYIHLTKNLLSESIRFNLVEVYLKMHECTSALNDIGQLYEDSEEGDTFTEMQIVRKLASEEKKSKKDPSKPNEVDTFWPNYMKDLVALIDFKKLSPHEFYDGPGKSSLLTYEQKYEFLFKLIKCKSSKVQDQANQIDRRPYDWQEYRDLDVSFIQPYETDYDL